MRLESISGKIAGRLVGLAHLRPETQLLGRTVVAGSDPLEFALTYDDGPNLRNTPRLLELLEARGIRATFFLVGDSVRRCSSLVREMHAAGHLIGNHTMTHPFLATMPASSIAAEIRDCSWLLEDVIGAAVKHFRAPNGGIRPKVLRIARSLQLKPVQWNVDSFDWQRIDQDEILQHVEAGWQRARSARKGANILLHDGLSGTPDADRANTVRATSELLDRANFLGCRAVTVESWS